MKLKLLTLNIHAYQEENQLEKFNIIAETIAKEDYDIITLQEVSQKEENKIVIENKECNKNSIREDNPIYIITEILKNKYNIKYNYNWINIKMGYAIFQEGIAIMSKYPIDKSEELMVSCEEYDDIYNFRRRILSKCKINFNGNVLNIYSVHFGLPDDPKDSFVSQFNILHEDIIKYNNETSIFAGDFNIADFTDDYKYVIDKGYVDLFDKAINKSNQRETIPGKIDGWEENSKKLRIDYAFSNKGIEVIESNVIFTKEKYGLVSDHYGVEVVLNI